MAGPRHAGPEHRRRLDLSPEYRHRWQHCSITWAHATKGQPYAGATEDIRKAFQRVQDQTGFTFEKALFIEADVRLKWSTASQNRQLAGTVAGIARVSTVNDAIAGATITLDRETPGLSKGFDGRNGRTWGNAFTHEVAHGWAWTTPSGTSRLCTPTRSASTGSGGGDQAGLRESSSACQAY